METISYSQFRSEVVKSILILFIVIVYVTTKLILGSAGKDYAFILALSVLSLFALSYFLRKATKMLSQPELSYNWFDRNQLGWIIITLLGVLCIYLFGKGIVGIYHLFKAFRWPLLFQAILTIVLSYKLVLYTANIQGIYNFLERNNWYTPEEKK